MFEFKSFGQVYGFVIQEVSQCWCILIPFPFLDGRRNGVEYMDRWVVGWMNG